MKEMKAANDIPDAPGSERRSYVRIQDTIPILSKVLTGRDGEVKDPSRWFDRVWNRYPISDVVSQISWEPDSKEAIQAHMMMELHRKMDLLVDLLDRDGAVLQRPVEQAVSLSASGIRMTLPQFCKLGDRVALFLVLPELPPVNLYVTGEVIRVGRLPLEGKTGYDTAINFLDLGLENQDRLIKYIFRRLRIELREGRPTTA